MMIDRYDIGDSAPARVALAKDSATSATVSYGDD